MDTVLIIIGVLGLGAMVIAAYVFTVAARNYVSEGNGRDLKYASVNIPSLVERSKSDRRQLAAILDFPITVNGVLIENNRRQLKDRRLPA